MAKTTKTVKTEVKFFPQEKCMVLNYNRRPPMWEEGTISSTRIGVNEKGIGRVSYDVLLDRRSYSKKAPEWGNPLRVTVGDDGVEPIQ